MPDDVSHDLSHDGGARYLTLEGQLALWRVFDDRGWTPDSSRLAASMRGLCDRYLSDGVLYAARAINGLGPIKLGRSTVGGLWKRFSNLQVASALPLALLVAVPEWAVSEREAHERWQAQRTRGEWFEATAELLEWLASLPALERARAPIQARVAALATELLAGGRPLARLARIEEKVAAALERQRGIENARRERELLLQHGCAVCGGRDGLTAWQSLAAVLPHPVLCRNCHRWVPRIIKCGTEATLASAEAAVARATAKRDEWRERIALWKAAQPRRPR